MRVKKVKVGIKDVVTVQPTAKTQRTQRKKLKEGVSSPIKSQCFQKFSVCTF